MPVDYYPFYGLEDATVTFRRATPTGATTGYGKHTPGPDPSTDTVMNVIIIPFDVIRRLAFIQAMGGSIDIRLWWVVTTIPTSVNEGDEFIVVEAGRTVRYIVQMVDPDFYEKDCTAAICRKEV